MATYSFTFSPGPLGIVGGGGSIDGVGDFAVVKGFSPPKNGVLSQAERNGQIKPGHAVVSINGSPVYSYPFKTVLDILTKASQPKTVVFGIPPATAEWALRAKTPLKGGREPAAPPSTEQPKVAIPSPVVESKAAAPPAEVDDTAGISNCVILNLL